MTRLGEVLRLVDATMRDVYDQRLLRDIGRVVEQWPKLNMLGLLQQIGAIPA